MWKNNVSSNLQILDSSIEGYCYVVEKSFRSGIGGRKTANFFKCINDHPIIMFLWELVNYTLRVSIPNLVIVLRLRVPLDQLQLLELALFDPAKITVRCMPKWETCTCVIVE